MLLECVKEEYVSHVDNFEDDHNEDADEDDGDDGDDDESIAKNPKSDNDYDPLFVPSSSSVKRKDGNGVAGFFRTGLRFVWSAEIVDDFIEWRCKNDAKFQVNGNRTEYYE